MAENLLEEVREACASLNISVLSLVETLDDARRNAEVVSKTGDILPDHPTRLRAAQALAQLLQLGVLGKAAAFDELSGKKGGPGLAEAVRARLEQKGTITVKAEPAERPQI